MERTVLEGFLTVHFPGNRRWRTPPMSPQEVLCRDGVVRLRHVNGRVPYAARVVPIDIDACQLRHSCFPSSH